MGNVIEKSVEVAKDTYYQTNTLGKIKLKEAIIRIKNFDDDNIIELFKDTEVNIDIWKELIEHFCSHSYPKTVMYTISKYPYLYEHTNDKGENGLMIACLNNQIGAVNLFINNEKMHYLIEQKDHTNRTPLIIACYLKYDAIANALLRLPEKCNLNCIDDRNFTALMWACRNEMENISNIILDYPILCNISHRIGLINARSLAKDRNLKRIVKKIDSNKKGISYFLCCKQKQNKQKQNNQILKNDPCICCFKNVDSYYDFIPCNHIVPMCTNCKDAITKKKNCPICRAVVIKLKKVYPVY